MYTIPYHVNDNSKEPELCKRPVNVNATQEEVDFLVENGYLILDNIFSDTQLEKFRQAIERVATKEINNPKTENVEGNGHYIRSLLEKDSEFHTLIFMERPMSISKATLGPQVAFDVEARVVPAGVEGLRVNWHIHCRVIPDPMPPFFCYPHSIHGLLYLDDIDEATGPICILPGSHKMPHLKIDRGNCDNRENQLIIPVKAGTMLLMHCNLWHRTIPTSKDAKKRRLILFGYSPSWIKSDIARGVKTDDQLTEPFRNSDNNEIRELLGEFYW